MKTATEARKEHLIELENRYQAQLDLIENLITDANKQGNRKCFVDFYYSKFSLANITDLEAILSCYGYLTKIENHDTSRRLIISW